MKPIITNIIPYKGGVAAIDINGKLVSLVVGKTYKRLGKDKKIHKAKYLGGGNFVYKTTIKDVFDYIKVLLPFLK